MVQVVNQLCDLVYVFQSPITAEVLGCDIQTEVPQNLRSRLDIDDPYVSGGERDAADRGPLCMVPAAPHHGCCVELDHLSTEQFGDWYGMILFGNAQAFLSEKTHVTGGDHLPFF